MNKRTLVEMARRDMLRLFGTAMAAAIAPLPVLAQQASPLRIGMVGAGRKGGTLGTLRAKAGSQVMFSSRHTEELKSLVDGIGPAAQAGTVEQAVILVMSWRSSCPIPLCSRSVVPTKASHWTLKKHGRL